MTKYYRSATYSEPFFHRGDIAFFMLKPGKKTLSRVIDAGAAGFQSETIRLSNDAVSELDASSRFDLIDRATDIFRDYIGAQKHVWVNNRFDADPPRESLLEAFLDSGPSSGLSEDEFYSQLDAYKDGCTQPGLVDVPVLFSVGGCENYYQQYVHHQGR